MTVIDPRFLVSELAQSEQDWLFNLSRFRGKGMVELVTFDTSGNPIPSGEVTAYQFIDLLNDACRSLGRRLRLYFYDAPLDGDLLLAFPNVVNLHIASHEFTSAEAVGKLPKLEELTYDAAFCPDPARLNEFGVERLKDLTIVETPDRKLDLTPLGKAEQLQRLRLMGQYRHVEAIAGLDHLRELVLYPARRLDLSFLESLTGLQVLKFAIGAMDSLESLGAMPHLRDLSFEWVRFLEEIGDLQRFPGLERFRLNDQKRVERIVTGAKNASLQHLSFGGAPNLVAVEGLGALPKLISLSAHTTGLQLDQLDLPASLTHLQIIPKLMKKRGEAEAAIRQRGLITEAHPEGDFFYK